MIDHCLRVISSHLVYACMWIKNINFFFELICLSQNLSKTVVKRKKQYIWGFTDTCCFSLYCIYIVIMYANFAQKNKYSCQKWPSPTGNWISMGFFKNRKSYIQNILGVYLARRIQCVLKEKGWVKKRSVKYFMVFFFVNIIFSPKTTAAILKFDDH